MEESLQKGKKTEIQRETEKKIRQEEKDLESATVAAVERDIRTLKPTISVLKSWTPQVTFPSGFVKSDIQKAVVAIKVNEAIKSARMKRESPQTRLPRLGAFQYLAYEFRQLARLDTSQQNREFCRKY